MFALVGCGCVLCCVGRVLILLYGLWVCWFSVGFVLLCAGFVLVLALSGCDCEFECVAVVRRWLRLFGVGFVWLSLWDMF